MRGDKVTAVDINPAQVAYLQARLSRATHADGSVERLLCRARGLGWARSLRFARGWCLGRGQIGSALLATVFWPLILVGINLHIH